MKDAKRVDFTAHYCTENQRVLLEHPLQTFADSLGGLQSLGRDPRKRSSHWRADAAGRFINVTALERWLRRILNGQLNHLRIFIPHQTGDRHQRTINPGCHARTGNKLATDDHALSAWLGTKQCQQRQ